MRIGEVAEQVGVSVRSVRHYEAAGLIDGCRLPNGYRDFDEAAVVRVRNIRRLLAVGLTLSDVAEFDACLDGDVSAAPADPTKIAVARRRLLQLQKRRDELAEACRVLEAVLPHA